MPTTVLCFGEILWDLLPGRRVLGGAVFNFANRMRELGFPSHFASSVGDDELGRAALARARELGMDTSLIQVDRDHPTGTVPVSIGPGGVPDFTIVPGVAYDHIRFTDELGAAAAAASAFCYGTLVQRAQTSRTTLYRLLDLLPGALKVYDVNLRRGCYSAQTVRSSVARATVVKLNDSEVVEVAAMLELPGDRPDRFARALLEACAARCCVITLGERGAFAVDRGGAAVYVPGVQVKVVDTIGSGDAFTAGFVAGMLRGEPLVSAVSSGNLLGALVATQQGATQPVLPRDLELARAWRLPLIRDPSLTAFEQ